MSKIYYELDEKEKRVIDRASDLTFTDYQLRGNDIEIETFITIIEDLICEVEHQKEKYEDLEQDLRDNYEPVSVEKQVGWNNEW